MAEKEPPAIDADPLTLEMADKWLSWLEDVATLERDAGYAGRFVQLALFAELVKAGIIDGERFIATLTGQLSKLENETWHLALMSEIDDLAQQLTLLKHGDTGGERPH